MRVTTVSEIKGECDTTHRDYPAEGTKTRAVYDVLRQSKGRAVDLSQFSGRERGAFWGMINRLRDDYGCDIRRLGDCHSMAFVLAGEWFGPHYSDYVVQAIDEAVKSGETSE